MSLYDHAVRMYLLKFCWVAMFVIHIKYIYVYTIYSVFRCYHKTAQVNSVFFYSFPVKWNSFTFFTKDLMREEKESSCRCTSHRPCRWVCANDIPTQRKLSCYKYHMKCMCSVSECVVCTTQILMTTIIIWVSCGQVYSCRGDEWTSSSFSLHQFFMLKIS